MNKKVLIILGVTVLVIFAGSFWFLQKDDVQENTNEVNFAETEIQEEQNNEDITEENQDIKELQVTYSENGTIDASNWKTYRNEEYGFSVVIPSFVSSAKIDSGTVFEFSEKNNLKSLRVSASDIDPAWWTNPEREFPGHISEVFRAHVKNYDVVYYETFTIIINSTEVSDRDSILIATVKHDDGYVEIVANGTDFKKLQKIVDEIILHLEINDLLY